MASRETAPEGENFATLSTEVVSLQGNRSGVIDLSCALSNAAEKLFFEVQAPGPAAITGITPSSGIPFEFHADTIGERSLLTFKADTSRRIEAPAVLCRISVEFSENSVTGTFPVTLCKATAYNKTDTLSLVKESGQLNLRLPQADLDGDGAVLVGSDIPALPFRRAAEFSPPALVPDNRTSFPETNFDVNRDGCVDQADVECLVSALLDINNEEEAVRRSKSLLLEGRSEIPVRRRSSRKTDLKFTLPPENLASFPVEIQLDEPFSFIVLDFHASEGIKLLKADTATPCVSVSGNNRETFRLCLFDTEGGELASAGEPFEFQLRWLNYQSTDVPVELLGITAGFESVFHGEGNHTILTGEVTCEQIPRFSRGDCNNDGVVRVGDAVFLISHITGAAQSPLLCPDACDINDDGVLDCNDPKALLDFLFGSSDNTTLSTGCVFDMTEDRLPDCTADGCSGEEPRTN
jgi:hypothetical protein